MSTYVYANFDNNAHLFRTGAWEMILGKLYGEENLRMDDSVYVPIEFKASAADMSWLEELIDDDYEVIFYGTLEEFYEEVYKRPLE